MSQSFPDSLLICTTFTHTSLPLSVCACMCMYVCIYQRWDLTLASCGSVSRLAGRGKKTGPLFTAASAEAWAAGGPLYPLYTHTPFPLVRLPSSSSSFHPIQAPAYLLSKAGPPSQPFINTSHYSSPSLHRDSKEISTLLVRPEAPQPFGPHKCKFRLSNLPVLIFVLKRCVHNCKTISPTLQLC